MTMKSPTHPPATNRGVETLTTEQIDWISFTLPIYATRRWPDGMETENTVSKSFNGYDTAVEYPDGRVELTSTTRPEMGIHCVLSGTTCGNCRDFLPKILQNCWIEHGRVTRFDLALDDLLGRTNPRDATEYIKRGEIICRAKQYPINQDVRGGGFTQYLGRMASEVHVCIYEKDAEQGITGFRTRVEIRFKSSKADKAAKEYLQSQDCRGLIQGFVRFPQWDAWNEVFAVEPIKITADKTDSKRVRWLLTQVARSMALEIAERQGDMQILEVFKIKVMDNLSDLRHKTE
jgi:hypothetical protein